jgi:hypothetical protein
VINTEERSNGDEIATGPRTTGVLNPVLKGRSDFSPFVVDLAYMIYGSVFPSE